MYKDFDGWNKEKQLIDASKRIVHPKVREIWYIKIGINIGNEIYGKSGFFRPVLVISKIGNMYFCMPLTTKASNIQYIIPITYKPEVGNSYIKKDQGRIYDMKRFISRGGIITLEEFIKIKNLLRDIYFPRDF